jgi:serine protease
VDRSNLSGGVYTATVSFAFSSPDQTLTVPVTMDVLPDSASSASTQYVLLINAATNATVARAVVTPSGGVYRYSFSGVPAGSYYLLSGSDLNNDNHLADEGEAVGAYPSLQEMAAVTVQSNRTGLDFVTGFQQWPFLKPFASTAAKKLN